MDTIEYADFKKLQMRVGKVLEVERVPNTDKLYKLQVDVGFEKPLQIVSSLVPYYSAEELMGKRIIVLVNLKPTKFAGQESNGMLLCAESADASQCTLLTTEKEMEAGTEVC
ncbi:MAG TPA: methionine--tRNA ligase subunit beta [Candidatus Diapherotrites archaeon]|uniref:Methionine--tRNA ligase n=1 Tax=Candidatus Iainarchaeum sp. TaxID=3101447 RepID=A0A7J4JEC3_9ARCH|nr:methionine--tRNA ligase subunit beta [Candidatus Diapherotrites archaeon]HIH16058.1 methionine--tRNA ligase subunit beta [Candidatus Diapherotrites archaeon]